MAALEPPASSWQHGGRAAASSRGSASSLFLGFLNYAGRRAEASEQLTTQHSHNRSISEAFPELRWRRRCSCIPPGRGQRLQARLVVRSEPRPRRCR